MIYRTYTPWMVWMDEYTRWWFQMCFLCSSLFSWKWSNLTNIFQMGWNHQPAEIISKDLRILSPFTNMHRDPGSYQWKSHLGSWANGMCNLRFLGFTKTDTVTVKVRRFWMDGFFYGVLLVLRFRGYIVVLFLGGDFANLLIVGLEKNHTP